MEPPELVPLLPVGVAEAEAHLLLLAVHGGGLLQGRDHGPLPLHAVHCLDVLGVEHVH